MRVETTSSPGHEATAVLSDCGTYRYELTRQWGSFCNNQAVFIMLNPSTADAFKDDNTIKRCKKFAERMGCDKLKVVNLFAYRSPYPLDLYGQHDAGFDITGPDNDAYIFEACTDAATRVRIAAWGSEPIASIWRTKEVYDLLGKHGLQLCCLGTTKNGSPRHPLYLPKDAPLINYKVCLV